MQRMIVNTRADNPASAEAISTADAADYVLQIATEIALIARSGGLSNVARALELARDLAAEKLQSGPVNAAPAREA